MPTLPYKKFLWNSVNTHGVHSPFVFTIVKALYLKTNLGFEPNEVFSKNDTEILCRILYQLKIEKIVVLGEDSPAVTQLLRKCGEKLNLKLWFLSTFARIDGKVDMIYISATDSLSILPQIEKLLPNMGSNTVCVVGNIHATEQAEYEWQILREDERITVTIDIYHFGLVFIRPEQAKEDFTIRIVKSKVLDFALGIRNLWGLLY